MSKAIERLALEAMQSAESAVAREAARRTGGLPVHSDMGGVVVLLPTGAVLIFDPEAEAVTGANKNWSTLALVRAAKQFAELRELAPKRPVDAADCEQCCGAGLVLGTIDCGQCFGTGWISKEWSAD
jgi:hypothetical protein